MAYNLSDRFTPPPKCIYLLDPGAYELQSIRKISLNKYPFLSKTPRNTQTGNKIWTHSLYYVDRPPKIPNCTTLQSKCPRFPYNIYSKEDVEKIVCRCGIKDPCVCPTEGKEAKMEPICQAEAVKYLYKGRPPKSIFTEKDLLKDKTKRESPYFNDLTVNESSAFYHGCKWSKWTSTRSAKFGEGRPGPADYVIEKRDPRIEEICAEKVRHHKRKTSKQLRFIDTIQERNIAEGRPGPATYSPELPKCINMQFYGPKCERFPISHHDERPGPADYVLKRDFELPAPPEKQCHATLPEQSCFGVKSQRFKYRKEKSPSPASYDITYKTSHFAHYLSVAFGSSAIRFKENEILENIEEEYVSESEPQGLDEKIIKPCLSTTWEFKSKTIRMKPIIKKAYEPSPTDLPQSQFKIKRLPLFQHIAPFLSSEGRFRPWHDWMPVFGAVKTPGPAYYCLESKNVSCVVTRGPLFRTTRFPSNSSNTPAPNKYDVGGGVETILSTYNQRLKCNMEKRHKFIWNPLMQPRKLNLKEQEMLLLTESIRLLDADIFDKCDPMSKLNLIVSTK